MWRAPEVVPRKCGAPGFIAIGSGPAGLSAAETFRSKHPHIPVRILTTDPALPYAKPPLSKAYLCGREAKRDLHSAGWFVRHDVELQRGITVDHIDVARQEVVTEGGRHYPYWHLVLACGANAVPPARSRCRGRADPPLVRRRRDPANGRPRRRFRRGDRRRPDRL
jgi:3-phenylpropionate/trans-cinnamate dioxygenase ferredoxin reductase component